MELKNSLPMLLIGHLTGVNMPFLYLLLMFAMFSQAAPASDLSYEGAVGWLHGKCFAIKNTNLKSGEKITVIDVDTGKRNSDVIVSAVASTGEQCFALLEDRKSVNISSGYHFYVVESSVDIGVAIGVLNALEERKDIKYDSCATSEGIEYHMRSGEKVIWSGYYYLGYDTESTCK